MLSISRSALTTSLIHRNERPNKMFTLIFDAAIIGIIIACMEEGDFPGWLHAGGSALLIIVTTVLVRAIFPEELEGFTVFFALFVSSAAGAVVGGVVISALCGMSFKRASIAASIYLGYKIAAGLFFHFAF